MIYKKSDITLLVLLSIGILVGCDDKKTPIHDTTQQLSSENTKDTILSEVKDMQIGFRENCIEEQTFSVELSEYDGDVYFVPYAPTAENPEFSVEIIQNGNLLTTLRESIPDYLESETFTSLDAVSFWDVNYDSCTDIVLIQTYGDTSFATIYYGFASNAYDFERYFIPQRELSDTITNNVANLTIIDIRNYISDSKKNGTFASYQEAYYYVARLATLEGNSDLTYNLIYFDEDDIPELVTGKKDYYVSLYTYKDGTVYMPMDFWAYGVSGNVGYEYVPYKNSMRNYNTEYAGAIHYTTYSTMNEQYLMDTVAEVKHVNFDDINQNGILDPEEENSLGNYGVSYLNGEEVDYKECKKYDVGTYEYMEPIMSLNELTSALGF